MAKRKAAEGKPQPGSRRPTPTIQDERQLDLVEWLKEDLARQVETDESTTATVQHPKAA